MGLTSGASLAQTESRAVTRSLCDCVGQQTALADELFVLAGDEGLGAAQRPSDGEYSPVLEDVKGFASASLFIRVCLVTGNSDILLLCHDRLACFNVPRQGKAKL